MSPSLAGAGGHREAVIAGTLETEVVPCGSLCTESEWDGPLDGTSSFTLISLEDLGIPNANLSRFHGDLVLSTPRGDLIGTDTGLWNLDTGAYVDVYTVTSGTGDYVGATAVIVLTGTLDPATGQGRSRYRGAVRVRRQR
jgi:hypothetical protein